MLMLPWVMGEKVNILMMAGSVSWLQFTRRSINQILFTFDELSCFYNSDE